MNKPSNTSELLSLIEDEDLRERIKIIDENPMNFRYRGMILSYSNMGTGQIKYEQDLQPHISFGKDLSPIRGKNPKKLLLKALESVDQYVNQRS